MSVFSIAPHAPFLPTLVAAIMDGRLTGDWPRTGPFWLSDITIIVPTQRARQSLAEAFARHPQHRGLLPDIRTFGGDEGEEEPFLPPFDVPALPKAATPLRRRLVLSQLVAAWAHSDAGRQAFSTPPSAAEIFSMADSLGTVLDDLSIEERTPANIAAIGEALSQELGAYWQQTLTFLDIALTAWPAYLAEAGLADPAALRGIRLDRQAAAAPHLFGNRPVIAAGSTGSIPATARLLAAIARLPRGAVVLPGLDMALTPEALADLRDPTRNPHGHPHYGLVHLLPILGVTPDGVTELADGEHPRTRLINLALAPTDQTAFWAAHRLDEAALQQAITGLAVIEARTEDEEGRAIALAARAALAEGKSVGIVTPDRNLARRIAAELARFDIIIDDAAGAPLFHAPAGRLARQVLRLVANRWAPVDLMALLRNQAFGLGRERRTIAELADAIELALLRGQRPGQGVDGLLMALAAHTEQTSSRRARRLNDTERADIAAFFAELAQALTSLTTLLATPRIDASALAVALWSAVDQIAGSLALRGRDEMAAWAEEMARLPGQGHHFAPIGLDGVLATLMSGYEVRNREQRRQDIAIWGQLEARLMRPELMILAGLNEDVWPAAADPGPWLSRGMRIVAGLEPPERQQGLAAHDFVEALGAPEAIIAFSSRIGTSPALPSRLVQRVDAFAGSAVAEILRRRGRHWLLAARRLDAVDSVKPASRPEPNPPVNKRPRQLSVTEIETLIRSPYDLYARHVLGLRPLDPLGEDPDMRERGTIIHAIFARFVNEGHDPLAADALEHLMTIAGEEFSGLEHIGERRDIWLKRFGVAAGQFLDFERDRAPQVRRRHAEIDGALTLKLAQEVKVIGRADRVDELVDGSLEILDFKTGSPPTKKAMTGFEAPQLPLEAAMARAGGMDKIAAADTSALTYVKIGLGPEAFKPSAFATAPEMDVMAVADEISRRMQRHIDHFLLRQTPMPARLLPLKTQSFAGAYDHLSRLAEWTAVDGEDEA